MLKNHLWVVSVAALCAAPMALAYDGMDSGITISPMIGHMVMGNRDGADIGDATTATLAVGYQFNPSWAAEIAYTMADDISVDGANTSLELSQVRLDALYHFASDSALIPYAVFGVGENTAEFSGDSDADALFNAGIGLKYHFVNYFALRSDVRAVRLVDSDVTDLAFNIGAHFLIGSSSKAKPVVVEVDSDGDGVLDRQDACPATPSGTRVDARGCAINNDSDGDGVLNEQDNCPDTKAGAKVDDKGCYQVLEEQVTVALNVNFANNSADIVSGADQVQKLATFMTEYPQTSVVIEGHTDSMGAAAYNQALSQKRAEAVLALLTRDYGVDAERIKAVGYGEEKPVATNDTAAGRAANRRVSAVVSTTVTRIAD